MDGMLSELRVKGRSSSPHKCPNIQGCRTTGGLTLVTMGKLTYWTQQAGSSLPMLAKVHLNLILSLFI